MLCRKVMYMLGAAPWEETNTGGPPWHREEHEERIVRESASEPMSAIPAPEMMPIDPPPGSFLIERGSRIKVSKKAVKQALGYDEGPHHEGSRSWPVGEERMCAANYSAVEIHGFFGLIDDGSSDSGRMLKVHVPRWIRGYFLDLKQGDTVHVYHTNGKVGGMLRILAVGRDKYYPPGRRITSCSICCCVLLV